MKQPQPVKRQIARKKGVSKKRAIASDIQPKTVAKAVSYTADKTVAVDTDDFLKSMIALRCKSFNE